MQLDLKVSKYIGTLLLCRLNTGTESKRYSNWEVEKSRWPLLFLYELCTKCKQAGEDDFLFEWNIKRHAGVCIHGGMKQGKLSRSNTSLWDFHVQYCVQPEERVEDMEISEDQILEAAEALIG